MRAETAQSVTPQPVSNKDISKKLLLSLFGASHGMTYDMLFSSVKGDGVTLEQFHNVFVGMKNHQNLMKDVLVFPKRGVPDRRNVLTVEGERACDRIEGRRSEAVEKRLEKDILSHLNRQKDPTGGVFLSDFRKPNGVKEERLDAAIRTLEEAGLIKSERVVRDGGYRTHVTRRPAPV